MAVAASSVESNRSVSTEATAVAKTCNSFWEFERGATGAFGAASPLGFAQQESVAECVEPHRVQQQFGFAHREFRAATADTRTTPCHARTNVSRRTTAAFTGRNNMASFGRTEPTILTHLVRIRSARKQFLYTPSRRKSLEQIFQQHQRAAYTGAAGGIVWLTSKKCRSISRWHSLRTWAASAKHCPTSGVTPFAEANKRFKRKQARCQSPAGQAFQIEITSTEPP